MKIKKKVAVINLSGNTGKTTTSKQLLLSRIPGSKVQGS